MKEDETMDYRILLVEDGSDSGTEQVPPPTGGHLRHAIKCGGVTPTSLDPKTRAAVWADNISPAGQVSVPLGRTKHESMGGAITSRSLVKASLGGNAGRFA